MPDAPAHVRCVFSGVLGSLASGSEIWSFGLSLDMGTLEASEVNNRKTVLTVLSNSLSGSWGTHVKPRVTPGVRLQSVKSSVVASDGNVPRDNTGAYVQGVWNGNIAGTGVDRAFPFQVASAVRLESDFSGPTGRGRFYVPLPSVPVDNGNGLVPSADTATFATNMQAFINDVNVIAKAAFGAQVVIASGGSTARGLAPGLHPVRRVRVGRVLDTMRSRRNALLEDYATLSTPAAP